MGGLDLKAMTDLAVERFWLIEQLQAAITNFREGNYPHPRTYRPNQCPHKKYYYEDCGDCDEEYWQSVFPEGKMMDDLHSMNDVVNKLRGVIELRDKQIEQLETQREAVLTIIGNLKWLSEWERTEIMKAIIPKEKNDGA